MDTLLHGKFPITSRGAFDKHFSDAYHRLVEDSGEQLDLPLATPTVAGLMSGPDKTKLNAVASGATANPKQAAQTAVTVVATTGTLPVANGSITIANAATPTVVELLEYIRELEAKLASVVTAIKAAGITN